jgi:acylphosphatase
MLIARRYVVSGRVQGVGFRFFTEAAAMREGVHGWVRNLPNGSVEARIEGDAEAVERVEAAIRRGPSSSRVDDVTVEEEAPTGRATGFSVR